MNLHLKMKRNYKIILNFLEIDKAFKYINHSKTTIQCYNINLSNSGLIFSNGFISDFKQKLLPSFFQFFFVIIHIL
jgi:hypothetical protein